MPSLLEVLMRAHATIAAPFLTHRPCKLRLWYLYSLDCPWCFLVSAYVLLLASSSSSLLFLLPGIHCTPRGEKLFLCIYFSARLFVCLIFMFCFFFFPITFSYLYSSSRFFKTLFHVYLKFSRLRARLRTRLAETAGSETWKAGDESKRR